MQNQHMAIGYAADAISKLASGAMVGGGATNYANCDLAVTALERALRSAKVARGEAKRLIKNR